MVQTLRAARQPLPPAIGSGAGAAALAAPTDANLGRHGP